MEVQISYEKLDQYQGAIVSKINVIKDKVNQINSLYKDLANSEIWTGPKSEDFQKVFNNTLIEQGDNDGISLVTYLEQEITKINTFLEAAKEQTGEVDKEAAEAIGSTEIPNLGSKTSKPQTNQIFDIYGPSLPPTMKVPEPTTMKVPEPTTAKVPEPTTMKVPEPTTAKKDEVSGIELRYVEPYNVSENHLTKDKGRVHYKGHSETWYNDVEQSTPPGTKWKIPGRHIANDGTIRDENGYICVAVNSTEMKDKGWQQGKTVLMTSLGPAKIYDIGCGYGVIDIYTDATSDPQKNLWAKFK